MKNRFLKHLLRVAFSLFAMMNIVAAFHAYKFTHFKAESASKTKNPEQLSTLKKITTLIFGVNNPRPENKQTPSQSFQTIIISSNKKLEAWYIPAREHTTKGTVILFHGYSGNKASMLDKSDAFLEMGYNTMLLDFMGSGGSEGNQTTVGFKEAEEVKDVFEYLKQKGSQPIYLFGTSMGAAAILKAINKYKIAPNAIIIECPFGTLYQTTCARFNLMHIPTFPMAGLLVFWGGIENGFWAFGNKPQEYAKSVKCPTLLLYGEQDKNVSRTEIDSIYANLKGPKYLNTFPLAGHEDYLVQYKEEWTKDVMHFLSKDNIE